MFVDISLCVLLRGPFDMIASHQTLRRGGPWQACVHTLMIRGFALDILWTWLARANAWIVCVSWRQTSIYQQSLLMRGVYSPEDSVACDVCSDATSAAKDSSICGMILHGGMHAVYASSLGWSGHGSGRQHARPYPERACPNCRNSRIRRQTVALAVGLTAAGDGLVDPCARQGIISRHCKPWFTLHATHC